MKNLITDMDGVLIRGKEMVPGADKFLKRLEAAGIPFLVLTNNPAWTPSDLAHRLHVIGLDVPADRIFTSSVATARFLHAQRPEGKAYVIGESGLTEAIHKVGYVITDFSPDYVVLGETESYNQQVLTRAIRLILEGARFIATNPDVSGKIHSGIVPGCGAVAAMIQAVTGIAPFYVGKPNPLMMRTALNYLGAHSEDTVMVGDRMDTDIVAGVEAGMETMLVLSGVTAREDVDRFPYQPTHIFESVADIPVP